MLGEPQGGNRQTRSKQIRCEVIGPPLLRLPAPPPLPASLPVPLTHSPAITSQHLERRADGLIEGKVADMHLALGGGHPLEHSLELHVTAEDAAAPVAVRLRVEGIELSPSLLCEDKA